MNAEALPQIEQCLMESLALLPECQPQPKKQGIFFIPKQYTGIGLEISYGKNFIDNLLTCLGLFGKAVF
jgi:hypothetical protein